MDREIPNSERRKAKRNRILKIGGIAVAVVAAAIGLGSMMRASVAESDLIVGTADTGTIEVTVTGMGSVSPAID